MKSEMWDLSVRKEPALLKWEQADDSLSWQQWGHGQQTCTPTVGSPENWTKSKEQLLWTWCHRQHRTVISERKGASKVSPTIINPVSCLKALSRTWCRGGKPKKVPLSHRAEETEFRQVKVVWVRKAEY